MITRTPLRRAGTVFAAGLVAALLSNGTASAEPEPPDPYATHVLECLHVHGFDGDMNPGMHHGRSGWEATHQC
jgi:hypothetical protein